MFSNFEIQRQPMFSLLKFPFTIQLLAQRNWILDDFGAGSETTVCGDAVLATEYCVQADCVDFFSWFLY